MNNRQRWFNLLGKTVAAPETTTLTATESKNMLVSNTDYALAKSGTPASVSTSPNQAVGAFLSTPTFYQIRRTFVLFDFSAVVGTITSANLKIAGGNNTPYPSNLNEITAELCTNSGVLTTADFSAASVYYGRGVQSGIVGSDRIFTISLNAAGIAKLNEKLTATRFVIKDAVFDYDNTTPTAQTAAGISPTHATIEIITI